MPTLTRNSDGSLHIHTYIRADLRYDKKDPQRYKCKDPHCSHTADRKDLKGKAALCVTCGTQIILTHDLLRLSRPTCPECGNRKGDRKKVELQSEIEKLLEGPEETKNGETKKGETK